MSSNFSRQSYEYFVDLKTSPDKLQIVQFTAGGKMPQIRLAPFFSAFKYFKLGRIQMRLVPAATLPVDPTGLSYAAGENTVDPRDQFNPGLIRITNGEDVSTFADNLTGTNAEKAYYATLLDHRWFKFALQGGCKRSATPKCWLVGQAHQSFKQGFPKCNNTFDSTPPATSKVVVANGGGAVVLETNLDWENALLQVNRAKLGWMPTDMFNNGVYGFNVVPEVDVITMILPKAYKTVFYYRCYITEEVIFKDAVAMNPFISTEGLVGAVDTGGIDRFLMTAGPNGTRGADTPDGNPSQVNPIGSNGDDVH